MANNKSYGISLLSFNRKFLTVEMINKFNQIVFNFFNEKQLQATYWGIIGKGISRKLTKFSTRKFKNLEAKAFLDKENKLIKSLSYIINIVNSNAPAFDGYLSVGLSYREYDQAIQVYFIANLNYLDFEVPYELFIKLTEIMTVDYGFVYFHKDYDHVSAIVLEYDDGKFEEDEYEKFLKWYGYNCEEKLKNIRDTYPILLLNNKYYGTIINDLINMNNYRKTTLRNDLIYLVSNHHALTTNQAKPRQKGSNPDSHRDGTFQ